MHLRQAPRFTFISLAALALTSQLALTPGVAYAEDPKEPERVVMRLDAFLRLYEESKAIAKESESPHAFAISSAKYRGEVSLENKAAPAALFSAKLQIDVLAKKGWARIPILPATVALQSAKIAGKEASVVIENGHYTLVTDRRGPFTLDLEFAASVDTTDGLNHISFELAKSGSTEVTLDVPSEQDLDFNVANAKQRSERTIAGKGGAPRREIQASLPSTGSLWISWQRQITQTEVAQAQVQAEVHTLVGIKDGVVRLDSTVTHTILFAGKESLRFSTPTDFTLVEVKGKGVRDWKRAADGTVEVLLNFSAEGAYQLSLVMEKVVGKDIKALDVPVVGALDTVRSKGFVGVESAGTIEISAGQAKEATPVDVRSLPAEILGKTDQPVLLGYKYLGASPQIPLKIAEHDDLDVLVTLLDQVQARTMWTREGRRLTSVRYQVRNNRRQFLRLSLPEGATLWSASVAGRATQPGKDAEGKVLIPLVRSQVAGGALASFDVEVVYVEDTAKATSSGRFRAELPRADVPTTYVGWTVYVPEDLKLRKRSFEGSVEHVRYLSNPIPQENAYVVETSNEQVQFQSEDQMASGGLGEGATPVKVTLPLQGRMIYLEKLIALDETLEVEFDYRYRRSYKGL